MRRPSVFAGEGLPAVSASFFKEFPPAKNFPVELCSRKFKPALTSVFFCGLAASAARLGQSTHSAPREDDVGPAVSLWKAITPNDPCFELMIRTDPNDGDHAKVSGALRAHEGFPLLRRDRFDFNQVVAEPAVVPLGVPPTQLHTVTDRCIQLADPTPKCRTFPVCCSSAKALQTSRSSSPGRGRF